MKTKELFLGLVVCLMVISLTVGLSACDKDDDNYTVDQRTGKFTSQYIDITITEIVFFDQSPPDGSYLDLGNYPAQGGTIRIRIEGKKHTTNPFLDTTGWQTDTTNNGVSFLYKHDDSGSVNGETLNRLNVLISSDANTYYVIWFEATNSFYNQSLFLTWAKTVEIR